MPKEGTVPFYQFTVPTGATALGKRAEVAAAFTRVHCAVTGAPAAYVHCQFTEFPLNCTFIGGEAADGGRVVESSGPGEVKH